MNYTLNFAHLCDYASLSAGKLNVLGIFENINSSTFPYVHPQMYVVTNIHFSDPGNYTEEIRITLGEETIAHHKEEIPIHNSNTDLGVIGQLNNTEFKTDGNYSLDILVNGAIVKKIPFTVVKRI